MLDDHPYVTLYLVGSGLVVALIFTRVVLSWALAWITKANVLVANLRKLDPPGPTPFLSKVGGVIGTVLVEALLSWINVAVLVWKILALLLVTTREALSSSPESVQRLRFPLRNNPDLPVESVWAYMLALTVENGTTAPDEQSLVDALDDACSHVPRFDERAALRQLEALNVVKPSVARAALAEYERAKGLYSESD